MISDSATADTDGTVYVTTADGERVIGSWQAGDAEAGLAYYVRRYEDLATEVSAARAPARLGGRRSGVATQDPGAGAQGAAADRGRDRRPGLLGRAARHAAGRGRGRSSAPTRRPEQAEADAVAAKQALADGGREDRRVGHRPGRSSGDRLRTIVDEWKQIKGVDRKTDDALWKRFSAARDEFGRRRGPHFARSTPSAVRPGRPRRSWSSGPRTLAESSDWKETASAMKDLMTEWKAARRARQRRRGRAVDAVPGGPGRASSTAAPACSPSVTPSRSTTRSRRRRSSREAEALDLSDPKAAQSALRDLQARFDEVGHVPRDAMRRIDDRMRAAEQRVRDAVDADWRRGSVETNPFLSALRERLAEAEAKLERAEASGDAARIAKAEAEVEQRRSADAGDAVTALVGRQPAEIGSVERVGRSAAAASRS